MGNTNFLLLLRENLDRNTPLATFGRAKATSYQSLIVSNSNTSTTLYSSHIGFKDRKKKLTKMFTCAHGGAGHGFPLMHTGSFWLFLASFSYPFNDFLTTSMTNVIPFFPLKSIYRTLTVLNIN